MAILAIYGHLAIGPYAMNQIFGTSLDFRKNFRFLEKFQIFGKIQILGKKSDLIFSAKTRIVSVVAMANWGYKGIIKTSSTPFLFRASRPLLIDGFPYRIASCIGTDTFACTLSLNFSDKTEDEIADMGSRVSKCERKGA